MPELGRVGREREPAPPSDSPSFASSSASLVPLLRRLNTQQVSGTVQLTLYDDTVLTDSLSHCSTRSPSFSRRHRSLPLIFPSFSSPLSSTPTATATSLSPSTTPPPHSPPSRTTFNRFTFSRSPLRHFSLPSLLFSPTPTTKQECLPTKTVPRLSTWPSSPSQSPAPPSTPSLSVCQHGRGEHASLGTLSPFNSTERCRG